MSRTFATATAHGPPGSPAFQYGRGRSADAGPSRASLRGGRRPAEFIVELLDEVRALDLEPGFPCGPSMNTAIFSGGWDTREALVCATDGVRVCNSLE